MKHLLLLLCLLLLASCSTHKYRGMEIGGDGKDCLDKENVKTLVTLHLEPGDKLAPFLAIRRNIVADSGCVGLYNCVFHGYRSNEIVLKVLKFENEVYMFDEDSLHVNERYLNDFLEKNRIFFSEADIQELTAQFKKGTEYRGSFF